MLCCGPSPTCVCANHSHSPEQSPSSKEQGWLCRESAFVISGRAWTPDWRYPPACRLLRQTLLPAERQYCQYQPLAGDGPPWMSRCAGQKMLQCCSLSPAGHGSGSLAALLCRAPWAELLTRDWPVMHILLTHVGMSQSLRGKASPSDRQSGSGSSGCGLIEEIAYYS